MDGYQAGAHQRAATLQLEGAVKQAADVCRARMVVLAMCFLAAFVVVGGRLIEVMAVPGSLETAMVDASAAAPLGRADVVDRNGVLLATNLPTASLYAEPRRILDAAETALALVALLPALDVAELEEDLASDRGFIWVKRNLTPNQQAEIHALGLPGLEFLREERRVYPQGQLTSHVVGFTDIDRIGLAGAEMALEDELQSRAAEGGEPLALSLDVRFQQVVREELAATIETFSALGGTGIVLDVHTGEVMAMVSLPDFDPNHAGDSQDEARFNRATLGVYELGSIFKVFTAGMALEAGLVDLSSGYDASEPLRVARFTIRDYKPKNRWLSLPEILVYSSNIGAARMAMDVGADGQQEFLRRIGLMMPSEIELPEVGDPIYPSTWREINTMTIGFGHGIAVTPIQAASALAAMVNGGTLYQPTVLEWQSDLPPPGTRVISEETSNTLRLLTHLVVEYGSGRKAQVDGYLIGGKTGTAEKLDSAGGYAEDRLLSSFAAAFPIDDPRYVILVSIDEPQGIEASYGYATGGWTAAPTVGRIISRIGPIAGIAPRDGVLPELPVAEGNADEQLEAILAAFSAR
ncbi:MAG: penicillin-binding protein 2 [Rhodospirillaceae bacterium]|nr:penicillin-binding protein 2 [Rhodospirillaceae bacterium]MBT6510848.1 penicillin-binding protein 2 [Rhodospirillaceae bacterium]MBT7614998.1 penicillin-binding protein 2 [Rhodospirillaceae bacterium]MBT7648677.1 penicillin-binding protein 2 [Rhodospirillaceae bacterium]